MKYFFLSYLFVAAIVVAAFGTRGSKSELPPIEIFPDMDHQAKVKYQTKSDFFADGLGGRRPVKGTVPIGFELPSSFPFAASFISCIFSHKHFMCCILEVFSISELQVNLTRNKTNT